MNKGARFPDPKLVERGIASANRSGHPLFLIILATKPCYIKLASLVFAFKQRDIPFLLVDAGQHYEPVLTGASAEFDYRDSISAYLSINGDLVGRTADLAIKLRWLANELRAHGLRVPPIPIVSGDTSTAAVVPLFWYLLTGLRSVHIEAGLRSLGPDLTWESHEIDYLLGQRRGPWKKFRDEPFPEGIDTTVASVASDLLFAPVSRNAENLISEGYDPAKIHVVGSLSADAVRIASASFRRESMHERYSELAEGAWLRVDIHRRENMIPERLAAVLRGVTRYADDGNRVAFVITNALRTAVKEHGFEHLMDDLKRSRGVVVQDLWDSYFDVIGFIQSPNCLGVLTDSGGLQEEANILGVPCITCRFSTDRPETILEAESNILLPPVNAALIKQGLDNYLSLHPQKVFPKLKEQNLYGEDVATRIVQVLTEYSPPLPARGAELIFK